MKYFPLVWNGLWRSPARTIFTLLSIAVAYVLFGILSGIDAGFAHTLEVSRMDRLFTDSRFGAPMPLSYADQIASVPGVTVVAPPIRPVRLLSGSQEPCLFALHGPALLFAAARDHYFDATTHTVGGLVFRLAVTPSLIALGIGFAFALGFVGGLFPAIRAASLPVADALRAT